MKEFNAPSMSARVPDDWIDASTYILIGPPVGDFGTSIVVNRSIAVSEPDVAVHAENQLLNLSKMPGFQLLAPQTAKDAESRPMAIVEFQWDQAEGPRLQQRQAFIWVEGDVYCLTASAPAQFFASVASQFAQVFASFQPKQWQRRQ